MFGKKTSRYSHYATVKMSPVYVARQEIKGGVEGLKKYIIDNAKIIYGSYRQPILVQKCDPFLEFIGAGDEK